MSLRSSIVWGVALTFIATASLAMSSFLGRVSFSLPGVLEITSSREPPRTEFQLNPLAPLLLADRTSGTLVR